MNFAVRGFAVRELEVASIFVNGHEGVICGRDSAVRKGVPNELLERSDLAD
jgi:hypothetical protein